jgi:D-alanine-D-alanine ligase
MVKKRIKRTTKKRKTIAILYHALPLIQTRHSIADAIAISDYDTQVTVRYMEKMFRRHGYRVQAVTVGPDDLSQLQKLKATYVFNLVDSKKMEIQIAKVLSRINVPYSGAGLEALMVSNNKIRSKKLFEKHNIPTPPYTVISRSGHLTRSLLPGKFPVIVKPAFDHASVGIGEESVAVSFLQFKKISKRLRAAFAQPLIAEEFIRGSELHVTVLELDNQTIALPLSELLFHHNRGNKWNMYGFTEKWDKDAPIYKRLYFAAPPRAVPGPVCRAIQRDAIRAFYALGFRDYARFDVRYSPRTKRWYFLEGNANAGFSEDPEDAMTAAIRAQGMTLDTFLLAIVRNAVR